MKPHVFDRPVAQHFLDVALAADRQIHSARAPEDVVELQAGLSNRRVVHDFEEACRVRHQGTIEERFVRVEQIYEVDEPVEIGGLALELQQDAGELGLNRLRHIGNKTNDAERLPFGLSIGGGLVDPGIVQNIDASFAVAGLVIGHWFLLWCLKSVFPIQ